MAPARRALASRAAVTVPLILAVTAGCAGQPAPTAAPEPGVSSSGDYQPVEVAGLDSCGDLPSGPASTGERDGLPDLELPCLVPGPAVNLAELGGKPVLVNLWATWCGPCREEMPILQDAHTKHGDKIAFLGVDTKDNPERAASFLQEVGVTYAQVVDLDGRLLSEHLRVPGLPVTVVIDAEGDVVKKHVGPFTEESLEELVHEVAGS